MNEQTFKPAWRSFYWHFFTMIVCLAAASIISVKWLPAEYQKWLWIVFAAAVAYTVCNMAYKRNSVLLMVKPDKISLERGIMGRQSIEIATRNIRTIQVNQSIVQRMLNVGDIRVASSGTDAYEISVYNMPSPHEIREAMHVNERVAVEEEEQGKSENKT